MADAQNTQATAQDQGQEAQREPLFQNIDGEQQVTEIESYCVSCGDNGITRLLLTRIPHFREVIVMAFECEHCGFKNNEIQSGSAIQELGIKHTCRIEDKQDLNRQVVKSESCSIKFNELDFEIPPNTQRGVLSTVEGIINRAIEGLSQDQPQRAIENFQVYERINEIIKTLQGYMDNETAFTITLDDPAGNSYIENLCAPKADPKITTKTFRRTKEHDVMLGLAVADDVAEENAAAAPAEEEAKAEEDDGFGLQNEVHTFFGNCSRCNAPCETKMHMLGKGLCGASIGRRKVWKNTGLVNTGLMLFAYRENPEIPHFKEVVIMATVCDSCGYKSNEVKAGGAISPQGKRITVKMEDPEDMSRDILKSETCGLKIPEIDLELHAGTLGGRFTTVEGLLTQVHEELESRTPFVKGDSAETGKKSKFEEFLGKLQKVIKMEFPFTLILDDPLANSYLQNLYAPDPDPNMTMEFYDRTWEQNEGLGLNDMITEGYEQQEEESAEKTA
ncbi:nucleolar zinc-finger protein [Quaeritorhiza haematococci]|nr:nucleolar zinc-finger protein [Quaeritorhiza haematococci]